MSCRRVFLSMRAPLGILEGIRLPGFFGGRVVYLGSFSDPEDIKILRTVLLRMKPQSTFCVSVKPCLHSDIHVWVPSFRTLRIVEN